MATIDIKALRRAVAEDRYIITVHADRRMGERRITQDDVKSVIETGDVIEEHLDTKPHPKVLIMAQLFGEPLYVSCAFDKRYAYIITVHRYDSEIWIDPWNRRRN